MIKKLKPDESALYRFPLHTHSHPRLLPGLLIYIIIIIIVIVQWKFSKSNFKTGIVVMRDLFALMSLFSSPGCCAW